MANSEDLQKKIIEAINAKIGTTFRCPLCQHSDWQVQLGTTFLPLKVQSQYGNSYSANALPNAALICTVCGNTHLLNLFVLLPEEKGQY